MPRLLGQMAISVVMPWLIGVVPAQAQLATQHIKGVVGLKGGSPPPPVRNATPTHLGGFRMG